MSDPREVKIPHQGEVHDTPQETPSQSELRADEVSRVLAIHAADGQPQASNGALALLGPNARIIGCDEDGVLIVEVGPAESTHPRAVASSRTADRVLTQPVENEATSSNRPFARGVTAVDANRTIRSLKRKAAKAVAARRLTGANREEVNEVSDASTHGKSKNEATWSKECDAGTE